MDRERFDALARLVWTKTSRRTALGALLGAALLGREPDPATAKPKPKDKRQRRRQRKQRKKGNTGNNRPCYPGTNCRTGPGQDASGCDFSGSVAFIAGDFSGSDLRGANFTGAHLALANFQGADLGGACLVDANLREADLAATDLGGAIFCRTRMPDGTINDSGCERGTRCCPTPPPVCPPGEECAPETCNHFGDFCGTVAGPCCPGWDCINPPLSACNLFCSTTEYCVQKVGPGHVCTINNPFACGPGLPGGVGCCTCSGNCVLLP
jgi:hypothetical protein